MRSQCGSMRSRRNFLPRAPARELHSPLSQTWESRIPTRGHGGHSELRTQNSALRTPHSACYTPPPRELRRLVMQLKPNNPTPWLGGFNINHGIEVTGATRTLYLSGQTSNGADGTPMHPGDLVAQFKLAYQNVKDALAEAGMGPQNIVRMNFYTTDVDKFMASAGEMIPV